MVILGSEVSLLDHDGKLAIKFGKIFPKGDCQSPNYQEKYSRRWFLTWEYGLTFTLIIVYYIQMKLSSLYLELKNPKFGRGN